MDINGTTITVQGGGGRAITLDLKEVAKIEARIIEVSTVTMTTAPELLSAFISAWKHLHENMTVLVKEKVMAERQLERIQARVFLDEAPAEFERRGIKGTADLRDALLHMSVEYNDTQDRMDDITAVVELVKGKLATLQMAYDAIKKVIQPQSTINMGNTYGRTQLG